MFTQLQAPSGTARKSLIKCNDKLHALLNAISEKEINETALSGINEELSKVNAAAEQNEKAHTQACRRALNRISRLVQKEHNYVVKGTQLALWMSMGMALFGVPIGTSIAIATDNWGLLGLGFAIGMPIGLAIGAGMEKKAEKEGRLLNIA